MNTRRILLRAAASLLTAGAIAGCATHHHAPPPAAASASVPAVRMVGTGTFFAGRLFVTVTISRGLPRSGPGANASGGRHGRHAADDAGTGGSLRVDSPMPPVTLRLKFQNRSTEVLTFSVEDFESDLGNFAVHPETVSLASGQSAEADPMTSQLGVTADTIPMKLALKASGPAEVQTLQVRIWEDPALSEWPGIRE